MGKQRVSGCPLLPCTRPGPSVATGDVSRKQDPAGGRGMSQSYVTLGLSVFCEVSLPLLMAEGYPFLPSVNAGPSGSASMFLSLCPPQPWPSPALFSAVNLFYLRLHRPAERWSRQEMFEPGWHSNLGSSTHELCGLVHVSASLSHCPCLSGSFI